MDEPCYREIHKTEFVSIDVRAGCGAFRTLPKSFDQLAEREAGEFAHEVRHWLEIIGKTDRRVIIERYEFQQAPNRAALDSGKYESMTFRIQWDGQQGATHAWAGEALKQGAGVDLVAALVGCEPDAIRNVWQPAGPPSVAGGGAKVGKQAIKVDQCELDRFARSIGV